MIWLLRRTLAVTAALLGSELLARVVGAPNWVALGLAIAAVSAPVLRDALRGRRLMAWLRETQSLPAPRDSGFWGELGYRIERALRSRDAAIEDERRRLQQFLNAIDASPNGVLLLDGSDQIDWCNSVAADHFGLDPSRDRRQRMTNLVRAPAFVAYLQSGRFADAVVFPGPQGRRSLSVLVRPYGDGMKIVLSQDVTERERADAMRRDLVANVSHEIRTPLTVVAGFVETLTALPLSAAERSRVLALMAQQTDRMQALVADLLTLAQLEGDMRPPPDRWLSVTALLRRAEAEARGLSGGRHELTVGGGDDVEIAGNDTELVSAIGNLITNAVRYTPDGGRIGVRWCERPDGGAAVEVVDTGIGIAREHLPRLTERFYRADGSRSRATGGTGLGLSIVKHVVQRHGGAIEVQSEPGKGSCFRLVFPAARVRQRAAPPGGAGAAVGAPGTVDG